MKKRVFISHSAKSDTAGEILKVAERALKDAGFDVFVDRSVIEKGDHIVEKVDDNLLNCHGAVLLLSEETIADSSVWVPNEVATLARRNRDLDDFILLPVFVPPMSPKHLADPKFDPANIRDVLGIHAEPLDTFPERLCDELKRLQAPHPKLDKLSAEIAKDLKRVNDKVHLIEAATLLGKAIQPNHGLTVLREIVARQMLDSKIRDVVDALKAARVPAEESRRIFHMVAPMWVAEGIVEQIERAREPQDAPEKQTTVVADSCLCDTGHMIVKRASCQYPHWTSAEVHCATGENAAAEIVELINAALMELAEFDGFFSKEDIEMCLEASDKPVFVIIPLYDNANKTLCLNMAATVLKEVRAEFPVKLILLALAGPNDGDAISADLDPVEFVRLGLSRKDEVLQKASLNQSLNDLQSFNPG